MLRALLTFFALIMTFGCLGQQVLTFEHTAPKSAVADVQFANENTSVYFSKLRRSTSGRGSEVKVGHVSYFIYYSNKKRIRMELNGKVTTRFSGDSIIDTDIRLKRIPYSDLKWTYRDSEGEMLICRFYSENKKRHVELNFTRPAPDSQRELLTVIALEDAKTRIKKGVWSPNDGLIAMAVVFGALYTILVVTDPGSSN